LTSELPFHGWKSPEIARGEIWTLWWMFRWGSTDLGERIHCLLSIAQRWHSTDTPNKFHNAKFRKSKHLVMSPSWGSVPRQTTDWPTWSAVNRLLLLLLYIFTWWRKQNRFPKRCVVVSCMFLVCVLLCVVCVFPGLFVLYW
jgi:hypothetical protein